MLAYMRREFISLFILSLLAFQFEHRECGKGAMVIQAYKAAPNCGHLECPDYQVVHSQDEFEITSYKQAFWMSTPSITSTSFNDAARQGFKTLLRYIGGDNEQGVKMNITAPVLVDIIQANSSSFIVHLYVPQRYQKAPPLSDKVHPVKLPMHKFVAVKRFGGFKDDVVISRQLSALKKSLEGTPWESASLSTSFSTAGYNSPSQRQNRVNEILLWFD